jgi:hypothetical protein
MASVEKEKFWGDFLMSSSIVMIAYDNEHKIKIEDYKMNSE